MQEIAKKKVDLSLLRKQVKAIDLKHSGTAAEPEINPKSLLASGFHECIGNKTEDFASSIGFALSVAAIRQAETGLSILFCSLAGEAQEYGELYACGLQGFGICADTILSVQVKKEQDLYWVAEESLSCQNLSAIVIVGLEREKRYNFTISRRLKIRTEETPVPLYFIRHCTYSGTTAADARWRIIRRPSQADRLQVPGAPLIGQPRFHLQLEKPIMSGSQTWEFDYDAACGFRLAQPLAHRPYREKHTNWRAA